MQIAIIAGEKKKELMAQFCIAYCGILSKHELFATGTTGKYISDATGLNIECLLSGQQGGAEQIASRISYDEIDMLLFFRDSDYSFETDNNIVRLCDIHNVPIATNIATAEVLVHGLDRGDMDWRDIVNPKNKKIL